MSGKGPLKLEPPSSPASPSLTRPASGQRSGTWSTTRSAATRASWPKAATASGRVLSHFLEPHPAIRFVQVTAIERRASTTYRKRQADHRNTSPSARQSAVRFGAPASTSEGSRLLDRPLSAISARLVGRDGAVRAGPPRPWFLNGCETAPSRRVDNANGCKQPCLLR